MLDQLPLDLIQLIVRHAIPPRRAALIDRERLDALFSLTTVCRTIGDAAQAVLYEVVELDDPDKAKHFLEEVPAKRQRAVQSLRFSVKQLSGQSNWADASLLVGFAVRCMAVSDLRFFSHIVDLSACEAFRKLRHLVIAGSILLIPRLPRFPLLTTLSLCDCPLDMTSQAPFLSRKSMPVLAALALSGLYNENDADEPPPLVANGLAPFLAELDTLSCDLEVWDAYPFLQQPHRCLVDFVLAQGLDEPVWEPFHLLPNVRNLRLNYLILVTYPIDVSRSSYAPSAERINEELQGVITGLEEAANLSLRLLYLPSSLHPTALDPSTPLYSTAKRLLEVVRELKVEVVFERAAHFRFESKVSPDFWKRCIAEREVLGR